MSYGENENVVATFENKKGSNVTKMVLTNYRVALESKGSWFKKSRGMQSVTLESVNAANLTVVHNPSWLWSVLIGMAIALSADSVAVPDIPSDLVIFIGLGIIVYGVFMYFRSRKSGIEIKAAGEVLVADAPTGKADAYDFVAKVMAQKAS